MDWNKVYDKNGIEDLPEAHTATPNTPRPRPVHIPFQMFHTRFVQT